MTKVDIRSGGRAIVCFWVAALMIILCAVALNNLLAYAEESESGVTTAEEGTPADSTAPSDAPTLPENLNTIIYDGGVEMPDNSVSAQYAIAVASERAESEYQKRFTGRVFCHLGRQTTMAEGEEYNPNYHWGITAEVEGGQVVMYIDALTGTPTTSTYYDGETDFKWFDTWTEDDVEKLGPVTS